MKILEANKFFYPRGGAETIFFETIEGLRKSGHEVIEFSMRNDKNFPSKYDKYFIPELPELLGSNNPIQKLKLFGHLFYSPVVARNLTALADDFEPEVAHLHNVYHHLSASIFTTLYKLKVPVIVTLHDVFPLVPNHSFMRGDTLDFDSYFGKPYNCLRYRCVDDKFLPSLAGTLEYYYYQARGIWKNVDAFVAPSEFMQTLMLKAGFPKEKLVLIKNPARLPAHVDPLGEAVLYLGRLHAEKGIKIFLEAASLLPSNIPIVIAGAGPLESYVKNFLEHRQLKNVSFVGFVDGQAHTDLMRQAKVVVVPSVFYENCSASILEAQAAGRLVVASNRGGNPELVINHKTGWLVDAESAPALARGIESAYNCKPAEAEVVIKSARENLAKNHSPERYFKMLSELFSVLAK